MNRSQSVRDAGDCRVPSAITRIFLESSTKLWQSRWSRRAKLEQDNGFDSTLVLETIRLPVDLQEAADDAEALLEATGMAAFHLPDGLRLFRVPTVRVM